MNFPHLPFSRNCCMHRMTLLEPDENTRLRLALDRWRFTTAAALFANRSSAAIFRTPLLSTPLTQLFRYSCVPL